MPRRLPDGTIFLQHPVFGIEHVEAGRLGDRALDHVVRGQRRVLDDDAGIFLALVGELLERVHAGAGIAQRDRVRRVDERRRELPTAQPRPAERGALQQVAPESGRRCGRRAVAGRRHRAPSVGLLCDRLRRSAMRLAARGQLTGRAARRRHGGRSKARSSSSDLDLAAPWPARRTARCVPCTRSARTVASRPTSSSPRGARAGAVGAQRHVAAARPDQSPGSTLWPPMKRATNAVRGRVEHLARRPAWTIAPSFITTIEVGQRHGLVLAVGDVDEGEAELGLQPLQLLAHAGRAGTGRAPTAARRAAAPAGW